MLYLGTTLFSLAFAKDGRGRRIQGNAVGWWGTCLFADRSLNFALLHECRLETVTEMGGSSIFILVGPSLAELVFGGIMRSAGK